MVNRDLNLEEKIRTLRKEYSSDLELDVTTVASTPMEQFRRWFDAACSAALDEPNAFVLSTVGDNGQPSSRVVLCKELSDNGFIFYTNYQSRKGREMAGNRRVAATFFWGLLERQVRIEGIVSQISRERSEEYFSGRPRGSQLGAAASVQSSVLDSRLALEKSFSECEIRYQGCEIPCPKEWGGYLITPTRCEFWQGRENRMHDRIVYSKPESELHWVTERLSP
jgi:pyridoxamine 5'-phosphate oxidase